MTVSTADLGGMGNGLGLPIANPLYGPATAAVMAQQAWGQNMQNAQAQTDETRARTNRDIQTLAPDIAQKQASTALTNQQVAAAQLENDTKNVLGPQGLARGLQADIMSKSTEAAQQQQNYLQRQIISNASVLDSMPPAQAAAQLEKWGSEAGLKPGEASTLYGGLAASKAAPPPNAGPANAAAQPTGGFANLRQQLLEANPEIFKERISQEGQNNRTQMTTSAELLATQMRTRAEQAVEQMKISADPKQASQYFTNQYYQLKDSNPDAAEEFRRQAIDAMNKQGFYDASANFARQAYNPVNPILQQVATNMTGKPGAPAPQPMVGGQAGPQGAVGGLPQPPSIGGQPSVPPQQAQPVPPPQQQQAPQQQQQQADAQLRQIQNRPDVPLQTKVQLAQQAGWVMMTDKAGNRALVSPDKTAHIEIPRQ